jgi:hypothetical protein
MMEVKRCKASQALRQRWMACHHTRPLRWRKTQVVNHVILSPVSLSLLLPKYLSSNIWWTTGFAKKEEKAFCIVYAINLPFHHVHPFPRETSGSFSFPRHSILTKVQQSHWWSLDPWLDWSFSSRKWCQLRVGYYLTIFLGACNRLWNYYGTIYKRKKSTQKVCHLYLVIYN